MSSAYQLPKYQSTLTLTFITLPTYVGFKRYACQTMVTSRGGRWSEACWTSESLSVRHHLSNLGVRQRWSSSKSIVNARCFPAPLYCQGYKPAPPPVSIHLLRKLRELAAASILNIKLQMIERIQKTEVSLQMFWANKKSLRLLPAYLKRLRNRICRRRVWVSSGLRGRCIVRGRRQFWLCHGLSRGYLPRPLRGRRYLIIRNRHLFD